MDNKKIWDANWKKLADYSTNSAGNRWAFYLIRSLCKKISIDDGIIIDVGCGIGNKTALLAELFNHCSTIGTDFSEEAISFAKKYYNSIDNLDFYCMDATEFKDNTEKEIVMVSAFELLEHIEDWKKLLSDMCRMSKKYVILSTPTGRMREYEKAIGHYRNFKKGEIEEFMNNNGYRTIDVLYAGFPFWSPITRDAYNFANKNSKSETMEVTYNPIVHKITYFVYRYLTFNRIGDQFVGLFEKE